MQEENKKDAEKWIAEEQAKKYNIDLKNLEKEQIKLAKQLLIKDSMDFSKITKIGGISNVFFQNKIISACVVLNYDFEVIEQNYADEKMKFPYIPGFRAYRELPAMISCFNSLDELPEVMFVQGHGISHQRLGLASHFSLACNIPSIGIADSLIAGEVKGEDIILNGKIVGKVVKTKEGSNPLYISPGNMISLKSAVELAKRFVKEPHKLPEPLHMAHRYGKDVVKELFKSNAATGN